MTKDILSFRGFCLLLVFILMFINITGFTPDFPPSVQAALFAFLLPMIMLKKLQFDGRVVMYWLWLPLCTILGQPESVFRSWERLTFFTVTFLVVSPMLQGTNQRLFRRQCLNAVLAIGVIAGVSSFFCYFLGINLMQRFGGYLDDYVEAVGHFAGITSHSMLLGPSAGLGAVCLLYLYFTQKKKMIKRLLLGMALLCVGSVMFSASRLSFGSTVIASGMIMYKYAGSKTRFLKIFAAVSILALVTSPLWIGGLDRMATKNTYYTDTGAKFDSRDDKVTARWDEFLQSPVWGQGFAAVDPYGKDGCDPVTGMVEPGSSWLFALSSTGIVGLLLLLGLYLRSFRSSMNNPSEQSILIASLVVFIGVHMVAEGYLFAASNVMSITAWLIMACGYDLYYENKMLGIRS